MTRDIRMFRGEFVDLNGGADFYARDRNDLKREGKKSLAVFLEMCREDGDAPRRTISGAISIRPAGPSQVTVD